MNAAKELVNYKLEDGFAAYLN